jgi:hypothetical protein
MATNTPPGQNNMPKQPITNINSINVNVTQTETKSEDTRPICRDFLNGRCCRTVCKFQHKITLQTGKTTEQFHSNQPILELIPRQVVSHMFIPGKGCCLISITNFLQQQAFNGLFVCNLADIIPPSLISRLLKSTDSNRKSIYEQLSILADEWADKLQKIIRWTQQSMPGFDKQNFGLVFIFDISTAVGDWLIKLGYTHKKLAPTTNQSVPKSNNFTQKIIDSINQLFSILFSRPSALAPSGYPLANINILVNYMNDELNCINKGCLEMLLEMITLSPNKYIGTQFYSNIYYIGLPPSLEMPLSAPENRGFIFSYITGTKFINLAMIYTALAEITRFADIDIGMNIAGYITELAAHNNKVYQTLFENTDKLKKALTNSIPTGNIRPRSLVIIGCNLDMEFDKQILTGLKEVVGAIDFTGLANSSTEKAKQPAANEKPKSKTLNECSPKSDDDCCGGDGSNSFTMSIILPIVNSGSGSSPKGPANQLNDMMRELLSGRSDVSTNSSKMTSVGKLVQNRVCTIGLNLIYSADGQLSLNQPLPTVPGFDKIKEYGQTPENRIILICSPRLTHTLFQDIVNQITKLPEYPNRISANFIDFNINPSLRGCLAYHNYRQQIQSNYGDMGQMAGFNDYPLIRNTKLWRRLQSYISDINPTARYPQDRPIHGTTHGMTHQPSSTDADCCQCCSCISRHGVGYVKFGNMPYIPKTILDGIKDDSWLPRF